MMRIELQYYKMAASPVTVIVAIDLISPRLYKKISCWLSFLSKIAQRKNYQDPGGIPFGLYRESRSENLTVSPRWNPAGMLISTRIIYVMYVFGVIEDYHKFNSTANSGHQSFKPIGREAVTTLQKLIAAGIHHRTKQCNT
jgi:hypothetical protein